jgi:hypothetical protein
MDRARINFKLNLFFRKKTNIFFISYFIKNPFEFKKFYSPIIYNEFEKLYKGDNHKNFFFRNILEIDNSKVRYENKFKHKKLNRCNQNKLECKKIFYGKKYFVNILYF